MYSVLIIDDEINAVRDIEFLLKNSRFKFSNIYKARSGNEAKRILLSDSSIKLILSDIDMPEVDGIQFLEYTKLYRQDIYTIFITGYAKFEYAHQAIRLGASGFLLKPIKEDEFEECIGRADEKIREGIFEEKNSDSLKRLGSILWKILNGSEYDNKDYMYMAELCGISENTHFALAMIRCVQTDKGGVYEYSEYIIRCLEKYNVNDECKIYSFHGYESDEVICLCVMNTDEINISRIFNYFHDSLDADEKKGIYIGISDINTAITREMYLHCNEAYYEKILVPNEHIHVYRKHDKRNLDIIVEKVKKLENSIFSGDIENIEGILSEILNVEILMMADMTLRSVYYIVVNCIILTINKLFGNVEVSVTNELLSDRILKRSDSVEDIIKYFYSFILVNCMKNSDGKLNIYNIVEFVRANYMNELTLNNVAKQFAIAPNYLSRLFKQETGESFIKYLNNLRIEKACEYLIGGNMRVIIVAEKVGYNDIQYFHRVFKKATGMTPIEYRMKNKKI